VPAIRVTLPDGTSATSGRDDLEERLSAALGRDVAFEEVDAAGGPKDAGPAQVEEYWPDLEELDYRDTVTDFERPPGTFFDAAPVHLLTTATLDRLLALSPGSRFEARRFRPNIVVATEREGFVEGGWVGKTISIGSTVRLRIQGPCPRCVMTTLAQGDLPKDTGILRAAARHNAAEVGVYADVLASGTVHRGDAVTVGGPEA
jgi:uncharacterized protein YcbX